MIYVVDLDDTLSGCTKEQNQHIFDESKSKDIKKQIKILVKKLVLAIKICYTYKKRKGEIA